MHSYKTTILRLQAIKKGLELGLLQKPNDIRLLNKLKNIKKEIEWFKNKKDPGVRII